MLGSDLIASHVAWQRAVLRHGRPLADIIVLRPGDRFVVCGAAVSRKTCVNAGAGSARKRMKELDSASEIEPYRGNCSWDALVLASTSEDAKRAFECTSTAVRTPPGLGNILQAVVSSFVLAIATRRVLLIEGWDTAFATLGPPLTDMMLWCGGRRAHESRARAWRCWARGRANCVVGGVEAQCL